MGYEIRILDSDRKLLAIVDDYQYISWTRRWQKGNKYEMILSHYSKAAKYISENNYIEVKQDGDREFIGIIEHKNIQLDQQGKITENWEVHGKSVLSRRICVPPAGSAYDEVSGDAETALKHYVDNNVINPADSNRVITGLINEANQNRGDSVTVRARYEKLDEKLTETAVAGGIGWEVISDSNNLIFQVIEGTDRSTSQSSVAPIIFSPDFGNIQMQNYQWSMLNRFNLSYVAGQGEGAVRDIETVYTEDTEPTGLDRREEFIDARDLDTSQKLKQRGKSKIEEQGPTRRFEAQILTVGPFLYREDWDLGDIVTVRNLEWNILAHLRVQEVTVSLDSKLNENITVAFGAPWPNFVKIVEQEIAKTGPSLRV